MILTNNGSDDGLASMLFKANQNNATKFGVAWAVTEGCYMTVANEWADPPTETYACDVVLVVVTSSDYTNNRDIAKCQPNVNFGPGFCVPDQTTKEIYSAINDMRANAYRKYRPMLQKIKAACQLNG